MAQSVTKNLGVITAYGMAVQGGYTGTKEQFYEILSQLDLHTHQDYQSTEITLEVTQPNMHYHYGILSGFTLDGIPKSDYECTFDWTNNANGCTLTLPNYINKSMVDLPNQNQKYLLCIKNRIAVGINLTQ